MKRNRSYAAVTCLAAFIIGSLTPVAHGATGKPDLKATAEKIVGQVANVKEGDRVVLVGDVRDLDLIEEMALAVWRRGGEPCQIVSREKANRRYFGEVPASIDAKPLSFALKMAEVETVIISISGQEYPDLYLDVPPERLVTNGARLQTVYETQLKRGVRLVGVGNGLYPTEATAKSYGLKLEQLAEIYWAGINVDYTKMQATGAALTAILAAGKQLRVTHPNGTDLSCRLEKRPVFVSDGVISDDDVAKGGPALQAWLPAGEVYLAPVPGTAEGKVVFDTLPFGTKTIAAATFTFKGGKLVAHDAKPGAEYELWKSLYTAAPAGKDEFAFIDIGINPNVKVPPGSKLTSWVPAGAVSLGFGGDVWAGGSNACSWGAGGAINGCTVTVDCNVIVENGILKVQ